MAVYSLDATNLPPPQRTAGSVAATGRIPHDGSPLSGFLLVSLVFQRAKQLQNGARPRVEAEDHKPTRVALLEVLADTVSWTVGTSPPAGA